MPCCSARRGHGTGEQSRGSRGGCQHPAVGQHLPAFGCSLAVEKMLKSSLQIFIFLKVWANQTLSLVRKAVAQALGNCWHAAEFPLPPPVGTERQFPTTQPKELFLLLLPARSLVSLRSWLLNSTRKAGREDEGCCVHQGLRAQGWDRAGIPRGGRWQGRGSGLWHISGCSTHGAQNGLWMEQRGPRYGVIPPGGHGLPR